MNINIKYTLDKLRARGAIAPSSKFLVEKMISKIDYSKDLNLLQLGFGTGVFTKKILKRITKGSTLVIFEVNKNCRKYKISDHRIRYIEDSAENITKYYDNIKFDHIISTLPLASLPKKVTDNIYKIIKNHLKKNGKFLQYQYSLVSKKDIHSLFNGELAIDFELLNLPPAFIYEAKNKIE